MKLLRVKYQNRVFYGAIKDEGILCLDPSLGYKDLLPFEELSLLPLVVPSKIVCVGLNYVQHAKELNMPLPDQPAFFLKPPSALISHMGTIFLPENIGRVDYEGELALVIGQTCKNVLPDDVHRYILGYTCANDVTARDLQKGEILTGRSKGYDTFCPIGPCIETDAPAPNALIRTVVNGKIRQESTLEDMVFSPAQLVSSISQIMTLIPGDLILTGTPHGVGRLNHADHVRVEIEGIGSLENQAENEQTPDSIIVQ